jgi:predicted TIM-barrel fold metal-dependent hydrolase
MFDRREFLRTATGAAVAGSLPLLARLDAAEPRTPIVDTHLHCFAGDKDPRFLYHPQGPYRPADASTPEQLLKCMDGAGVDYAIVVHPEPYQDDHAYLEHCLAVGGKRLKGTCLFFADRPGSLEKMPALAKKTALVAARVHAYAPDRQPPFGKPELKNLWKTAGDLGLAVQLHFEPRYAPGFEPLIKEFPATRVIIDHLGRPLQGTPEEHAVVIGWSKYKNTVMKISSLAEATNYPHRDIAPIVKSLVAAYGPDRLIYGGGFGPGATADSYLAMHKKVRALLGDLSAADQAKVLGGTAAKLFGFA